MRLKCLGVGCALWTWVFLWAERILWSLAWVKIDGWRCCRLRVGSQIGYIWIPWRYVLNRRCGRDCDPATASMVSRRIVVPPCKVLWAYSLRCSDNILAQSESLPSCAVALLPGIAVTETRDQFRQGQLGAIWNRPSQRHRTVSNKLFRPRAESR